MKAALSGVKILSYDHVGLRVTDPKRSLAFYAALG
jgi:catechol 2,3-dioxygenase-like lactoylglutathione lyase family enzyme